MSELNYKVLMPHEATEEMEVEFEENMVVIVAPTLSRESSRVRLTHGEFEAIGEHYETYKKMLEMKVA